MNRPIIEVPNNKRQVTCEEAIALYSEGHKILSTMSDEEGIYGAHVFFKEWENLDPTDFTFKEYKNKGLWYVLEE